MSLEDVQCPFLQSYYSQILIILRLTAEQGGLRSYIIYLLFIRGKQHFYEIVKETGYSEKHVNRVLFDLKRNKIVSVDNLGHWFLILDKNVS